jgi:hypothetical protein
MSRLKKILMGSSALALILCAASARSGAQPDSAASQQPAVRAPLGFLARGVSVAPPPGDLLLSRSVYKGTAATVVVGQPLPTGPLAVHDGTYPGVFLNAPVDSSFGVTSPIYIDREVIAGSSIALVSTLHVPTDQVVTSFSSKSELALHLSTDGRFVTFMGYRSPINALDVSNSNVPNHVDPTNPVTFSVPRAVAQIDARNFGAGVMVTPVDCYSGNNGRSAILDTATNLYYMAGNAGNGSGTEPVFIVNNTGVQIVTPGGGPATTVVGVQQGTPGAAKGFQFGFAVGLLGNPDDKSGKDDNFRGITIFDNTLYVTKGSGGNGINTVYQVGTAGMLPTVATASLTPITILPGLSTTLASKATATNPFGIWFANATTLYVADEGNGSAGPNANAGLQKWILVNGTWHNAYTIQAGLGHGVQYGVPGLDPAINPATDGLRQLTGRVNGDGTVTLWATTSTVSASGDQGADPNRLLTITDTLAFTTAAQAAGESFTLLRTAAFGEVLRGVQFVPISRDRYARELVEAALDVLQGLPESDFKSRGRRHELLDLLEDALGALRFGGGDRGEDLVERALGKTDSILDAAAKAAVVNDLQSALSALPADRRHRDDEGRDE